jgi:hypothetical protein
MTNEIPVDGELKDYVQSSDEEVTRVILSLSATIKTLFNTKFTLLKQLEADGNWLDLEFQDPAFDGEVAPARYKSFRDKVDVIISLVEQENESFKNAILNIVQRLEEVQAQKVKYVAEKQTLPKDERESFEQHIRTEITDYLKSNEGYQTTDSALTLKKNHLLRSKALGDPEKIEIIENLFSELKVKDEKQRGKHNAIRKRKKKRTKE